MSCITTGENPAPPHPVLQLQFPLRKPQGGQDSPKVLHWPAQQEMAGRAPTPTPATQRDSEHKFRQRQGSEQPRAREGGGEGHLPGVQQEEGPSTRLIPVWEAQKQAYLAKLSPASTQVLPGPPSHRD